jgi:hypothetical protein
MGAGNQQGSRLPTFVGGLTPQRLHASPLEAAATQEVARAYLLGALRDGTFNQSHRTFRFAQKERAWLEFLKELLAVVEARGWIYREGRTRNLHVLETTAGSLRRAWRGFQPATQAEQIAYVRGYFDAEGGIPQDLEAPFYVQFVQKDLEDLTRVRDLLEQLGIRCGAIHNPSRRVDPDYWRFFVRRNSHARFIGTVGSWHPRKARLLRERVKI